jgi:2-iminobutanoate/2-iminopropanoate deaminase
VRRAGGNSKLAGMARRISYELPGIRHDNPLPAASRIGPFLVSSGVAGKDPATGKVAEGIEAQCGHMFANVRKILELAGGTPEDVLKVTVWLKDRSNRAAVNRHWLEMFPDEHSRPARHTLASPDLGEPMLVQCEFMAVLGE